MSIIINDLEVILMYIVSVLCSACLMGVFEIVKKLSLKKSNIYEMLCLYCLSAFALSLIFIKYAVWMSGMDVVFVFAKSLIIVVNWLLVTKAVEKLDVSIVAPFGLFTSVVVVVLSTFVFKEKITLAHVLSMLFIGGGILLLARLEKQEKKRVELRYIVYLLIGTTMGALSSLMDKAFISERGMDFRGIMVWLFLFLTIFYSIICLIKNKKIEFRKLKSNYWIFLTALMLFLSDIAYYTSIGMTGSKISIIAILKKFSVVIATILASVFLHEKHLVKKLFILALMLIGVAMPVLL